MLRKIVPLALVAAHGLDSAACAFVSTSILAREDFSGDTVTVSDGVTFTFVE